MGFVHLHLHTEYSLLDGACRVEPVLDAAKAMGMSAVAITDHGAMYGVIDFYKAAKKRGIKPIIGCEVYVAQRTRFDKVHGLDSENRHLVLLCKNETGYKNLIKMVSLAWTEGFYSKPRVDLELLEKYADGLIASSACLAGEIPRALTANDYEGAKKAALRYQKIFGEGNFYLELQDHGLADQKRINPKIIQLSRETGIPMIVTNDCHYIEKADTKMHHVLICIQTNHTVEDDDTLEFGSDEFYFKSEEQMRALFPEYPEACDNTVRIAEQCNLEIEFGKTKLPAFVPPDGSDSLSYFRNKCYQGLYERYGKEPEQSLVDRLEYEIGTITKMGYVNYYLIVHDYVSYAKSAGIPVGPGRGSGAGSLAAYCIGITGVDPIRYELIFERFLNPERVSMPDFDIDFSDERRQEIIDYVVGKYGSDHVAQIVAFDTMAARAAVRDVGRALAFSYAETDAVAKLIPKILKVTIDGALTQKEGSAEFSPELREKYDSDERVRELLDMSRKIEGMPRHTTTHAAGVVITDIPVCEYVPLAKNDEATVTQFTMTELEELGLIKMDFLGLRNLSVIDGAEKLIRASGEACDMEKIPLDDPEVFKMIAAGNTDGVFQFESDGMKRLLMQSKPESVEDLIAVISLFRPGPMKFIPMYVENRHHPEKVTYRHPRLAKILNVTYGCVIYQEQVMQICRELAGYSLGRADMVRRAMSKKKADVMEKEKHTFIHGLLDEDGKILVEGCVRRGVDEKTAETIFGEMESFASYAFNKSHAACYAIVAYRTAWLKCHYPREYLSALLTSVLGESAAVAAYIAECTRLGIRVLPPHVNESQNGFTVVGNDIRFGLQAVKNIGKGFISEIIEEREKHGKYASFYDFCKRIYGKSLNRRALESLIKCGALDYLGNNRREMLESADRVLEALDHDKRRNVEGQMGLFDLISGEQAEETFVIPKREDYRPGEKLSMEKEVTGMYLSGHPMASYLRYYEDPAITKTSALLEEEELSDGETVTLFGILTAIKKKTTKNNSMMAFATLEDVFGSCEILLFPSAMERNAELLREGKIVCVCGRISISENKPASVICEKLLPPVGQEGTVPEKKAYPGLYLKFDHKTGEVYRRAMNYVNVFDGAFPLYLYFRDGTKPVRATVSPDPVLVRELKKLLGDENVKAVGEE